MKSKTLKIYRALAMAVVMLLGICASNGAQAQSSLFGPMSSGPYDWSGLYIGGHAGWGEAGWNIDGDAGPFDGSTIGLPYDFDDSGLVVGGTIGYNYLFDHGMADGHRLLVGIEADIGYIGIDETHRFDTDFDLAQQQLGFYADITGRVGLVFDRFLIYAKGGVAFADIDLRAADFDGGGTVLDTNDLTTLSGIRTGYVVGGGIDIALNEIWSVNAEYRYMDFGTEYSTNLDTDDWYHKNDVHLVTIGVKAKLGDLFGPMGAN
ncbi:MAG: porin family protein [Rhodobiaceae bacterium]|nr:porin family protein [Rhodobiaceae bacterium]